MSNQTWYVDVRREQIEAGVRLNFHTNGEIDDRKPILLPGDNVVLVFTNKRFANASVIAGGDSAVLEIEDGSSATRWQIRPVKNIGANADNWVVAGLAA